MSAPEEDDVAFLLRAWPAEPTVEMVADELDRIAGMIRDGFTAGEAMMDEDFAGQGWWSLGSAVQS